MCVLKIPKCGFTVCTSAPMKRKYFNRDPLRPKKLLMHKDEIRKLTGKISEKGFTIVPLQVYFKDGRAKIEIGLARGKKLYDKRQDIAKKDQRREAEKEFKVKTYIKFVLIFIRFLTEERRVHII